MSFSTTAVTVLLLISMAVPGYILVKIKMVKPKAIAYFSAVLLYVSQPFLSLRSFLDAAYTKELAINLGIVFVVSLAAQAIVFLVLWLILRKKFDDLEITTNLKNEGYLTGESISNDVALNKQIACTRRGRAYRIMVLACAFGNVGFFGVPVLQFLFPEHPEAIAYSAVYIVSMNLMCWTVGSYVLTGDKKHIKLRRAFFNPQMLTLYISLPLFFAGVTSADLPDTVMKVMGYLADMTAPLSMLILGMRFAVAPLKEMFVDWRVYVSTAVKNLVFPLLVYLVLLPFQIDATLRATLIVLSAMPCATINLNLAELYDADQKAAANTILFSTLVCILTIPLIMLLA
jgi:predicted permease